MPRVLDQILKYSCFSNKRIRLWNFVYKAYQQLSLRFIPEYYTISFLSAPLMSQIFLTSERTLCGAEWRTDTDAELFGKLLAKQLTCPVNFICYITPASHERLVISTNPALPHIAVGDCSVAQWSDSTVSPNLKALDKSSNLRAYYQNNE